MHCEFLGGRTTIQSSPHLSGQKFKKKNSDHTAMNHIGMLPAYTVLTVVKN